MTRDSRIAASECVRLMRLMAALAEAKTPHSKDLALIVGLRLLSIKRDGAADPLSDEQIEPWLDIAEQLEQQ